VTLDTPILLHSTNPPTVVDARHVHFTFSSGRFGYDCATCKAQCCRGNGYALLGGREIASQVSVRPAVRFFLELVPNRTDEYLVKNCPPTCFFLDKKGWCSIQTSQGYAAKPEICRLFPFNYIRKVGPYLVVSPHPKLCPLQILPGGTSSDHSRHESLHEGMAFQGLRAPFVTATSLVQDVDGLFALENEITALSETHLEGRDYLTFADAQLDATRRRAVPTHGLPLPPASVAADPYVELLCAVLGATPGREHRENVDLVRTMVAATPTLRSHIVLRLPADEKAALPMTLARLPYFLLGLHTLGALACEAGMSEITYQTVMRLFKEYQALLTMLAYLDAPMAWLPEASVPLSIEGPPSFQTKYLDIARALVPKAQRRLRRPLGEILAESVEPGNVSRVTFLSRLAGPLMARIGPIDGAPRQRASARTALQHWALGNLAPETLLSVAHRPR
jgi:Fe-S-cluster containining protein